MNKLLLPQDIVGGSFWLISVGMIGAAIFFFLERRRLSERWGTVMTLVGVIALMSSIHYFYDLYRFRLYKVTIFYLPIN